MAVIDLAKCVTYGKLKGVRETKGSTNAQTYDLTGNAEVSFEWYVQYRSTVPNITLNVDNGTEIHLVNKSFANNLNININFGTGNIQKTISAGGDGFESHAIVYANKNNLVTLQEWKAESDFWEGSYFSQSGNASTVTAGHYRKIYLLHNVDYDTTVTVYPGQEIWALHNSSNSRIINCVPSNYFESGVESSQIILSPGQRAICMTAVNKIEWVFSTT